MKTLALAIAALALGSTTASAITASLHSSNVGIGSLTVSVVGDTITLDETWTSTGPGFVVFSDLAAGVNYTVVKNVTNNTGASWISFANELLDPSGQDDDTNRDPSPQPSFVPAGFSTSSDFDGLSFAQGSGLPRTSTVYTNVIVDEASDSRDFIDFSNGVIASGGVGSMTFGLRDNNANNQPFLLSQRVNARSIETPAPAALALLGLGVALLAAARRR